jgi:hypothetical protein
LLVCQAPSTLTKAVWDGVKNESDAKSWVVAAFGGFNLAKTRYCWACYNQRWVKAASCCCNPLCKKFGWEAELAQARQHVLLSKHV